MNDEVVGWDNPKWDALFVVCRDCRKRKNGPDDLQPKKLVRAIRSYARASKPRPRTVLCGCLGLCPKGANAVAYAGHGQNLKVISVETEAQLESALARLTAQPAHRPRRAG